MFFFKIINLINIYSNSSNPEKIRKGALNKWRITINMKLSINSYTENDIWVIKDEVYYISCR